jgi:hypothetical protein
VNLLDRHRHHAGDGAGRQRRRGARDQQRAAAGLGDARGGGVDLARPQAERLEESGGPVEAVTAELAQELLQPVADEEAADDGPENRDTERHA